MHNADERAFIARDYKRIHLVDLSLYCGNWSDSLQEQQSGDLKERFDHARKVGIECTNPS